jgi:hypothetical protein
MFDEGFYQPLVKLGVISKTGKVLKPFWEVNTSDDPFWCYGELHHFISDKDLTKFLTSQKKNSEILSVVRVIPRPVKIGYVHQEF